jgi:hypothetical protein
VECDPLELRRRPGVLGVPANRPGDEGRGRGLTEDQVVAAAAGLPDVLGEDHPERLAEEGQAYASLRLRVDEPVPVVPAALDADPALARICLKAVDVRDAKGPEFAATQAGE